MLILYPDTNSNLMALKIFITLYENECVHLAPDVISSSVRICTLCFLLGWWNQED